MVNAEISGNKLKSPFAKRSEIGLSALAGSGFQSLVDADSTLVCLQSVATAGT